MPSRKRDRVNGDSVVELHFDANVQSLLRRIQDISAKKGPKETVENIRDDIMRQKDQASDVLVAFSQIIGSRGHRPTGQKWRHFHEVATREAKQQDEVGTSTMRNEALRRTDYFYIGMKWPLNVIDHFAWGKLKQKRMKSLRKCAVAWEWSDFRRVLNLLLLRRQRHAVSEGRQQPPEETGKRPRRRPTKATAGEKLDVAIHDLDDIAAISEVPREIYGEPVTTFSLDRQCEEIEEEINQWVENMDGTIMIGDYELREWRRADWPLFLMEMDEEGVLRQRSASKRPAATAPREGVLSPPPSMPRTRERSHRDASSSPSDVLSSSPSPPGQSTSPADSPLDQRQRSATGVSSDWSNQSTIIGSVSPKGLAGQKSSTMPQFTFTPGEWINIIGLSDVPMQEEQPLPADVVLEDAPGDDDNGGGGGGGDDNDDGDNDNGDDNNDDNNDNEDSDEDDNDDDNDVVSDCDDISNDDDDDDDDGSTDVDQAELEVDAVTMENVTIEHHPGENRHGGSTTPTIVSWPVGDESSTVEDGVPVSFTTEPARSVGDASGTGSRRDREPSNGRLDDDSVGSSGDASVYSFGGSDASGEHGNPLRTAATSFSPHTASEYSYGSSRSFSDSERSASAATGTGTGTAIEMVGDTDNLNMWPPLSLNTPPSPTTSVGAADAWWTRQSREAQESDLTAPSQSLSQGGRSPNTMELSVRVADANSALQVALDAPHGPAAPVESNDAVRQAQPSRPISSTAPHGPICHVEPRGSFGMTAPRGSFGMTAPCGSLGSTAPSGSLGSTAPSASFGLIAPRGSFGLTAPSASFGLLKPRGPVHHTEPRGPTGLADWDGHIGSTRRNATLVEEAFVPSSPAALTTNATNNDHRVVGTAFEDDAGSWATGDLDVCTRPVRCETSGSTRSCVPGPPEGDPHDVPSLQLKRHQQAAEEAALRHDAHVLCLDRWHWLSDVKLASSWLPPESNLRSSHPDDAISADVHVYSTAAFFRAANEGVELNKPVLIRGDLTEGSLHTVEHLAAGLRDRFGTVPVRIRKMGARSPEAMCVEDLAEALRSDGGQLMSLDLRDRVRAQRPTMTYLRRFELLDVAITHAAEWTRQPDRHRDRGTVGDTRHLTVDHVDTSGAFRGPQIGAFGSTCVRILTGTMLCMFVSRDAMADDWEAFTREGLRWRPHGKQRAVLLQPNDQLFLPAGTVSAWYTMSPSVSMHVPLWDDRVVVQMLQWTDWALKHPQCTAGVSVGEIPTAVDGIEGLVRRDIRRYASDGPLEDFSTDVQESIKALRQSIHHHAQPWASMPQRRAASSPPTNADGFSSTHDRSRDVCRKRPRIH